MSYIIHTGDNRDILKTLADNSIDAIVTDPPYGIDFLGKSWDANTGAVETYEECLRVLKPGGHILAFSAARTYHHLAITLEQAGFEIRDQIMWIYSSGFPKSQDVGKSIQRSLGVKETKASKGMNAYAEVKDKKGKEKWMNPGNVTSEDYPEKKDTVVCTDPQAKAWEGWGTALKPAHEPICLARKPLKQSIAANCQEWGTGALNIDATRIEWDQAAQERIAESNAKGGIKIGKGIEKYGTIGEDAEKTQAKALLNEQGRFPSNVLGEILQADYQKYFYCPKVSRQERHIGYDLPPAMFGNVQGCYDENGERYAVGLDARTEGVLSNDEMLAKMGGHYTDPTNQGSKSIWLPEKGVIYAHGLKNEYSEWCKKNNIDLGNVGNNHPTVKPVELMKYLIKLITPPGGTVLDPFNGSGTTGMAAVELGFNYIGCELDPAYVEISEKRIEAWRNRDYHADVFDSLFTFGD
jgi:DNA modification methylase